MQSDESVEELVDRLIDNNSKPDDTRESFNKLNTQDSFRYIRDDEEIKSVLTPEGVSPISRKIGHLPIEVKMVEGKLCLAGLGDSDIIEDIIQRHIHLRKISKK